MAADVIIHVGQSKAGSTAIQKSLMGAKEVLAAQGAFYLGLMCEHAGGEKRPWQRAGGWPDLAALGEEKAAEELAEVAVGAVESLIDDGYRRVILSNETFLPSTAIVFPAVRGITALDANVRVIAYIRRPDSWAQSAYLQWGIKHKTYTGPLRPFREWLGARHKRNARELKPWLELPGVEVVARNFDTCGDVVEDFLACAGLEPGSIKTTRGNESPHPVALALWALYNGQRDDVVMPTELEQHLKRSGLLDQPTRKVDLGSLLWDDDEIARVWNESRQDREQLNEILREAGQPEIPSERQPARDFEVTQSQINAALLLMLKYQGDQIQRLKRQLRQLGAEGR